MSAHSAPLVPLPTAAAAMNSTRFAGIQDSGRACPLSCQPSVRVTIRSLSHAAVPLPLCCAVALWRGAALCGQPTWRGLVHSPFVDSPWYRPTLPCYALLRSGNSGSRSLPVTDSSSDERLLVPWAAAAQVPAAAPGRSWNGRNGTPCPGPGPRAPAGRNGRNGRCCLRVHGSRPMPRNRQGIGSLWA